MTHLLDISTPVDVNKANAILEVMRFANILPSVVIVHELPTLRIPFMSNLGLELIGCSMEEVRSMTGEQFQERFLNKDAAEQYTPKIIRLLEENSSQPISYFQQVRTSKTREWEWYMSSTKILLRDESNSPLLLLTIATRIDADHCFTAKANRLLEENDFLKNNYDRYAKLTKREKEIVTLMAKGNSANEIGVCLHISEATVETHKKNIRKKIGVSSPYDLIMFTQAFNLL